MPFVFRIGVTSTSFGFGRRNLPGVEVGFCVTYPCFIGPRDDNA